MGRKTKIKKVVFHWSEAIVITETIDPNFKSVNDASYQASVIEAQTLITHTISELNKLGKYSYQTYVTFTLADNQQRSLVINIKACKPHLTDYLT